MGGKTANQLSYRYWAGYFISELFLAYPVLVSESMARITVEDCLKTIPNRFELVLAATYRARQLVQGHAARVDAKDKATVVALREVAAGVTDRDMLTKVPL